MPSQVQLFTQAELAELNSQLDQLKKNLNAHINGSMSKVHGINIVSTPYYDNGGDRIGEMVLAFHFGDPPNDTTIYVPCRLTSYYATPSDPGPHSTSDGGLSSTTTGSNMPGVPIQSKTLVTYSPSADAFEQAYVYNQLLLAHSNMTIDDIRELQAHGGTSHTTEDVLDTYGHTIGRNTVTIGVNGRAYKLPGDVSMQSAGYGPPQTPRGAKLFTLHSGSQWYNRVHRAADDDQEGTIYLKVPTSTATFKTIWQTNGAGPVGWPSGSNPYSLSVIWYDLNPTGAGGVSGSCHAGRKPTTFSISANNRSCTLKYSTAGNDSVPVQFVRVKFVGGFGNAYTNVCLFSANDEDGSWIFGGPDSDTDYYYDRRLPGAALLYAS